jgi:hypothetical protein
MKVIEILKSCIPAAIHPYKLALDLFNSSTDGGTLVISGPFRGMRYMPHSLGSAWYPKLLGTYELELHPILERLFRQDFSLVLDVGAAEGYYAVGMALRCTDAKVIAFEVDEEGQDLIRRLAELNAVCQRVSVRGLCDVTMLKESLEEVQAETGHGLVIMDVEGDEERLLDPGLVPELKRMHILVELHDCWRPGLDRRILERFDGSHEIERIWARERSESDLPMRSLFLGRWLKRLMHEFRPDGMSWLYMRPLSASQATGSSSGRLCSKALNAANG